MKPTPDPVTKPKSGQEQRDADFAAAWVQSYGATDKTADPSVRNYQATQAAAMVAPQVDPSKPVEGVNLGRRPLGLSYAIAAQTGENLPEGMTNYVPMSGVYQSEMDKFLNAEVERKARENAQRAMGFGSMMDANPTTAGINASVTAQAAGALGDVVARPAIAALQAVDTVWENAIAEPAAIAPLFTSYFVDNALSDGLQMSDIGSAWNMAWENKNHISFGQAVLGNAVNMTAKISHAFGLTPEYDDALLRNPAGMTLAVQESALMNVTTGSLDFGLNMIPLPGSVAVKATRRMMGLGTEVRTAADLTVLAHDLEQGRLFDLTHGAQGYETDLWNQAKQAAASKDVLEIAHIPMIENQRGAAVYALSMLHRVNRDPEIAGDMMLASVGDTQAMARLLQRAPDMSFALGRVGPTLQKAVLTGSMRTPMQEKALNAAFESAVEREEWSKGLIKVFFHEEENAGLDFAVLGRWKPTTGRVSDPNALQRALEPATTKASKVIESARGEVYQSRAWRDSGNPDLLPDVVDRLIQTTENGPMVRLVKFLPKKGMENSLRWGQWATSKSPLNVITFSGTRPDDIVAELLSRVEQLSGLRAGQQFPIALHDVDGVMQPLMRDSFELRRQWVERLSGAMLEGDAAVLNAWRGIEDEIMHGMMIQYGLTDGMRMDVIAQVRAKANKAMGDLKGYGYFYNEHGEQVLFGDKAATMAQLVDHEYLLDLNKIEQGMKYHEAGFRHAAVNAGDSLRTGFDMVGSIWRTSMLLKPGYTFRNSMFEPGISMMIAQLPYWLSVQGLHQFAQGWVNFGKNNVRRVRRVTEGGVLKHQSTKMSREYMDMAKEYTALALQRDQLRAEARSYPKGVPSADAARIEAEKHIELATRQMDMIKGDLLDTGLFHESDFVLPSIGDVHTRVDELLSVAGDENSNVIQRLMDERAARWNVEVDGGLDLDLTPPDMTWIDTTTLRAGLPDYAFDGGPSMSEIKDQIFGRSFYSGLDDVAESNMLADVIDLMNVDERYARIVNFNRAIRTSGVSDDTIRSLEDSGVLLTPQRVIDLAQDADLKRAISMYHRQQVVDLEDALTTRINDLGLYEKYGDGTVFHGGAFPEEGFTEQPVQTLSNVQNLKGIGVYTTEAGPIAAGYLKTGEGPRDGIYYIKMTADDKAAFLDLDRAASFDLDHPQLDEMIARADAYTLDQYGVRAFTPDDAAAMHAMLDRGATSDDLREWFTNMVRNNIEAQDADGMLSRNYHAQMAWVEALKGQGFKGVRHVGGKARNEDHNVFIWYSKPDADKEIRPLLDLERDASALRQARTQSRLANDDMDKALVAEEWERTQNRYDSWLTDLKDLSDEEMGALRMALAEADVPNIALKDSDGVTRKVTAMTMDDVRLDERLETLLALEQAKMKGGRDWEDLQDSIAQIQREVKKADKKLAFDPALDEMTLERIAKIEDSMKALEQRQLVNRRAHADINHRRQKLSEVITQGRGSKNVNIHGQTVLFREVGEGMHGNAFLAEAASGMSAGQTFSPGVQNNISVGLASARDFRQRIGTVSIQDPNYFDELWHIATRFIAPDPMFRQMLGAKTFEEMQDWAKSPAGLDHFKALGSEGKKYQKSEMVYAYDLLYRLFPTPEARRLLMDGNDFTAGEFQKAMLSPLEDGSVAKFEPIVGNQLELMIPNGPNNRTGNAVKKAMETMWNYIAIQPETRLARWPFYTHEFEKEWTQRMRLLADQGVELTPAVANAQRQAARRQALYSLEKTFYNIRRYQNPVYALRFVSSFPGAFFNSIYRYAYYLPTRHPGNMLATINVANSSLGAFSVDANGNEVGFKDAEYLVLPGTGDSDMGDPGVRIPLDAVTRVFLDNPARSWLVAISADTLANLKPDWYETIREHTPKIVSDYLFTEFGPSGGDPAAVALGTIEAGWAKSMMAWWQGEGSEEWLKTYGWAWNDSIAQNERNGIFEMPDSKDIEAKAGQWYINKFLQQFFMPISYKVDAPGQMERDTWHRVREENPTLSYDDQKAKYYQLMGGDWAEPYTASTSVDVYGMHGNYSNDALKAIKDNPDLAESLTNLDPKLVGLLAAGSGQVFSRAVYNNTQIDGPFASAEPFGKKKTPADYRREYNQNAGWAQYEAARTAYLLTVKAAKNSGNTVARKRADDAWWFFLNNTDKSKGPLGLYVRNTDWAGQMNGADQNATNNIALGLDLIIKNEKYMTGREDDRNWRIIGMMLDTRSKVKAAVHYAKRPEDKRAIKDKYIAFFETYAMTPENNVFRDLWDRYFSTEFAAEG